MDVIIDGYNLVANQQGLRGALEHKRNGLVQQLARYQKAKGFFISVVFDGWKAGQVHEMSEKVDGVTVIFSRQGEKADSVVVRLALQRGSGRGGQFRTGGEKQRGKIWRNGDLCRRIQ